MNNEQLAWLRLLRAPGVGPQRVRKLLQAFDGSVEDILTARPQRLRDLGIADAGLQWLQRDDPADVQADIDWLKKPDCQLLVGTDPRFPARLRATSNAPVALFVRGDVEVLSLPSIAIVGSRNPTSDGVRLAEQFAAALAAAGLTVVSGLATGVDGAAHRGALIADGLTVAVCATGLDRVYPARHLELAQSIAHDGALVSEFPLGTPSRPGQFPRRNLTISGLSLGVLVVEAARKSGSLITARLAMEQGREVFAIPGSVHNPLARGCHALLREGAKLVETAEDVLEELAQLIELPTFTPKSAAAEAVESTAGTLDPDYLQLLETLGSTALSVDEIVQRSGLTADAVSSMLLILELDGHVEARMGGGYIRCLNTA